MMSTLASLFYGMGPSSMFVSSVQCPVVPQQQYYHQLLDQQHMLPSTQYCFQPSYIVASMSTGNYLIPSSAPQQPPMTTPQMLSTHTQAQSSPSHVNSCNAPASSLVPYLLDVNALTGMSGNNGNGNSTITAYSPVSTPMLTMLSSPGCGPTMIMSPPNVSPLYPSAAALSACGMATSTSPPTSVKKNGNRNGSTSGNRSKATSPKAGAKASVKASPEATLPIAKTFEEEPVDIDTTKRQLIVNYLPQKLTNNDFKALFRQFGEIDEERSHIVFDFRTAGGVNAELFAWYWKRSKTESATPNATVTGSEGNNNVNSTHAATPEARQREVVFAELIKTVDFTKVEKQMRSKGYGFVYYKDGASTEQALKQLNGFEVNGRKIKVRYAEQQRSPEEEASAAAAANTPTIEADANDDTQSNVSFHAATMAAAATANGSHHTTPSGDRLVSPVTPPAASQIFMEGAEPTHITTNTTLKVHATPVSFELDAARSEQSIISSIYDLLEVSAE